MNSTIDLKVGRLYWGKVRSFLNECKFKGMDIDFIESDGWLQRDFIVKGSDHDMSVIKSSFDNWVKENNL